MDNTEAGALLESRDWRDYASDRETERQRADFYRDISRGRGTDERIGFVARSQAIPVPSRPLSLAGVISRNPRELCRGKRGLVMPVGYSEARNPVGLPKIGRESIIANPFGPFRLSRRGD